MAPRLRGGAGRAVGLGVVGVGLAATIVFVGCRRPPQMGSDEAVFTTVDALFTAVAARDPTRLGECEARLRGLRDGGALPAVAADYLDGVTAAARAGEWEAAAGRLYDFMLAQRREGGREPKPHPKSGPARR